MKQLTRLEAVTLLELAERARRCSDEADFNRLISPSPNKIPLRAREREIIQWISKGKNTWEISVILGISERTVKFHVSLAMQKLDAVTRAHAVAIAITRGFISID